jgi:hypothetical protein
MGGTRDRDRHPTTDGAWLTASSPESQQFHARICEGTPTPVSAATPLWGRHPQAFKLSEIGGLHVIIVGDSEQRS